MLASTARFVGLWPCCSLLPDCAATLEAICAKPSIRVSVLASRVAVLRSRASSNAVVCFRSAMSEAIRSNDSVTGTKAVSMPCVCCQTTNPRYSADMAPRPAQIGVKAG